MEEEENIRKLLEKASEKAWTTFLPHISIDCVVFGFHEGMLKVLLLKTKGQTLWGLPGGYMGKEEEMLVAANRILNERTGVHDIYLQQFEVFARVDRNKAFFESYPDTLWNKQRFISVGFYALVDHSDVTPTPDEFSSVCEWKDIANLPDMMMDHSQIFEGALLALRKELNYHPIGHKLLPEDFTIPELQRLYEIILGKKLNRGSFYRKIMSYDILDKMDEPRRSGGAHKAPHLYRFNPEKYAAAVRDGLKQNW